MTKFAAYNDQAIWGTGATADEALDDARQWIDNKDADQDIDADVAALSVAPMSPQLAAKVEACGGSCGHTLLNGVLVTWDEAEAA